jgi:uncharacterized protein (TIGR04255 family)
MQKSESRSLPDYEKPPVIEVVCGIIFETIEMFRGHHPGLFWQMVRDQFPTCEHALRLGLGSPPKELDFANYFPRIWFVSEEQNRLIQLQDDRFFYNWRRIREDEAYPRYRAIIEPFKSNLEILQEFLSQEKLGSVKPKECELTYINHIPKGEGWKSLSDINAVFRDFTWDLNERFLPPPLSLGGQAVFPLPEDNGRLKMTLQHGERKLDRCPLLILQISARGLGGDKSMDTVWEWFELAHEWIVRGFDDMTAPTIQRDVWRRLGNG